VRTPRTSPTTDLVAIKSAVPSYTRTYSWTVDKTVDLLFISQLSGSATATYTVTATKNLVGDSNFAVTGEVTLFNPNSASVTCVHVSHETLGVACSVSGGSPTIAAGEFATFTYSCSLAAATARTTGTNEATVAWDQASIGSPSSSTAATAPYDFANATVTPVGDTTAVTDWLNRGVVGFPSKCAVTEVNAWITKTMADGSPQATASPCSGRRPSPPSSTCSEPPR
jgi:hypothetical protein